MTTHDTSNPPRARFSLGQVVATPGAIGALEQAGLDAPTLLARHQSGDWGDVGTEDHAENELALGRHLRIFSVYRLSAQVTIWIVTEADRSATTLLMPDEY